jgi:hypothetical protein
MEPKLEISLWVLWVIQGSHAPTKYNPLHLKATELKMKEEDTII